MRIVILVEGRTEKAFAPHLRAYLKKPLVGKMPNLDFFPYDGRIPTGEKLNVALHDFEAWLLPYWEKIKKLTGSNRNAPGNFPEAVNHHKSPACWLAEVFRTGSRTASYVKTRDAGRILQGEDLSVAIDACPELKSFVDTIVKLCGPKRKSGQGK